MAKFFGFKELKENLAPEVIRECDPKFIESELRDRGPERIFGCIRLEDDDVFPTPWRMADGSSWVLFVSRIEPNVGMQVGVWDMDDAIYIRTVGTSLQEAIDFIKRFETHDLGCDELEQLFDVW